MTDKEVFSPHGRLVLGIYKDNDVLGHGAIRKYFGKDNEPMEGGTNLEVRDFWNVDKLPPDIAKLISEFDNHWYQMFTSGVFQNDDLRFFICQAPDEWKNKASEQLLKQNPTENDLCYIIIYSSDDWNPENNLLWIPASAGMTKMRFTVSFG